jgi:hypothetical protein
MHCVFPSMEARVPFSLSRVISLPDRPVVFQLSPSVTKVGLLSYYLYFCLSQVSTIALEINLLLLFLASLSVYLSIFIFSSKKEIFFYATTRTGNYYNYNLN